MNMQKLMADAKKMQKDLEKKQEEIKGMEFIGNSELVDLVVAGNHEIKSVKIKCDTIEADDMEVFEDMLIIAYNDALKKLSKETEKKLGSFAQMGGLF